MRIGHRTNMTINITGLSIMLLTVLIKIVRRHVDGFAYTCLNLSRTLLYLLFFALWTVTLKRRIIQKTSRDILIATACFEMLWLIIRTVKYDYLKSEDLIRLAWYLYYLPLLMNVSLYLLLAVSMKKSDDYKPNRSLLFFPAVSAALFLLVLTNDLHSAVFIIPRQAGGLEVGNYRYGWGYFLVMAYISLCIAASYLILLAKCRTPNRKVLHLLPLVPLTAGTAVGVWYALGHAVYFGFYHLDITVFICFYATATLEMCIQSGLIMSNNGYNELFHISSIHALITDSDFTPLIGSKTYGQISGSDMERAKNRPVMLTGGLRLSSSPIQGGYIMWQDDLSELYRILQELSEKKDYLREKNDAIQQSYSYQKRERQLIEKNRLYNQILTQTKDEIKLYAGLIEQLAAETDPQEAKMLTLKMAFVGAFIKRHDNLIFLNEMDQSIDPAELSYCIEESLSNLRIGGIDCFCSYNLKTPIPFETIARIYQDFYHILFALIDCLSSVCVYLIEESRPIAVIRILCGGDIDLSDAENEHITAEREEEEWVVTLN